MFEVQKVKINLRAHTPIFEQIADQIRMEIESGELKANDQLPTVRQLAELLQINFNTVARAYRVLDNEGWISMQQGRGSYVLEQTLSAEDTSQETRQQKLEEWLAFFFHKAYDLGYRPEEVLQTLQNQAVAEILASDQSSQQPSSTRQTTKKRNLKRHSPNRNRHLLTAKATKRTQYRKKNRAR